MPSKFSSNGSLREMIDTFQKMQRPPLKAIFALEMALAKGFAMTQANVHVITSSLRWSGKTDSNYDGDSWEGNIEYGGASTGVHNPVEYAKYEQQRGGAHDFMNGLDAVEAEMDIIVRDMWNDAI